MARSKFSYTFKEVAVMIGENLELLGEITANSDNIAEGEFVYVRDGSEDGTKGLTTFEISSPTYGRGMVESASSLSMNNAIPK